MKNYIFLCILINLVLTNDEFLNNFQICKKSDPNLNDCLKKAIQNALTFIENGVEKFKIPSMQPLEIKKWTVKGTDVLPFEQKYENGELYNYATSTIDKVQALINDDDFSIHIYGHVPMVKFVGQYQFDNAVFYGEDLTGNGTMLCVEYGNIFLVNMTGQVNRDRNIPTLEITSAFHVDVIEKLDIKLNNVHIDQSDQSSDHMKKHWKIIVNEVRVGYSEMYAFAFKGIANVIFSQLDYDKLFE